MAGIILKYEIYDYELLPLPDDFEPPEEATIINIHDIDDRESIVAQCYILSPRPVDAPKIHVLSYKLDGKTIIKVLKP